MDLSTTVKRPSLGASLADHTTFDRGHIGHDGLLFACRIHLLMHLIVDASGGQEPAVTLLASMANGRRWALNEIGGLSVFLAPAG